MRIGKRWPLYAFAGLLLATVVMAQDADRDALVNIEQEYASSAPVAPGALTPAQKYMYDGPLMQLSPAGTFHATSKSAVLGLVGRHAANSNDPNAKRTTLRQDYHVEVYGDAALIGYNETITETGHQDASLDKTDYLACLDTFVKRDGKWYGISNACSRANAPAPAKP